jgi:hypothetical protein
MVRIVRRLLWLIAALALGWPCAASAHDIPFDVTVQAFIRPEGHRLLLLVRAPLAAMRDIDFPTRGPGQLDLSRADEALRGAARLWLADAIALYEEDVRLPYPKILEVRASFAGDKSFVSFDQAYAHVTGPRLPGNAEFVWNLGLLDALFEYPIQSDHSKFAIGPALGRLGVRVATTIRFIAPSGVVRAFELSGDPGTVRLDPRWAQAAATFVKLGFRHILDGTDHLLFLLCLVIPFRRARPLVAIVTSFTVAHSMTLIASAYDLGPDGLWFPPLIETLIAASIVYMALENIVSPALSRRWIITFAFGLVHGFGFSFALKQTLQFAGSHLLTSLFAFNVGVELGQLLVLAVAIPGLNLLFRYVVAERMGTIILSALVAHTGWHWMIDRGARLGQYRIEWPELTPVFWLTVVRWAIAGVALAALVWIVAGLLRRRTYNTEPTETTEART